MALLISACGKRRRNCKPNGPRRCTLEGAARRRFTWGQAPTSGALHERLLFAPLKIARGQIAADRVLSFGGCAVMRNALIFLLLLFAVVRAEDVALPGTALLAPVTDRSALMVQGIA
jgi:hypothetical protein